MTVIAKALDNLTDIQRQAVEWDQGPLLVLAGPGSGKTQVLTCRIARLLAESRDKRFRVLALTFTNKAADEMKDRVARFVPGLEERATIATFHGFCGQILRQHGVHVGINPNFAIYSTDDDRRAVFEDGLRTAQREGQPTSADFVRYLPLIDRLKARLIEPANAEAVLSRFDARHSAALAYKVYEDELRRLNALDFNSLIFEAYRLLMKFPALAAGYRRSYPYWLIDEFQDTNSAQYRLLRSLAGDEFRNVFAVADDDQIIYQWNGASFHQIQAFRTDFQADLLQLPTNFRCPPSIVQAANRLVAYNTERTKTKAPLIAGKTVLLFPPEAHLQLRTFATDQEEAEGIATEIAALERASWKQVAVLARTRTLLDRMHRALQARNVPSIVAQRRDDFLSPEFRWMVAILKQIARPLDRRNMKVVVEAFNRIAATSISSDQVLTEAEATGRTFLATWFALAMTQTLDGRSNDILTSFDGAIDGASDVKRAIEDAIHAFSAPADHESGMDLAEDARAWGELSRDIQGQIGRNAPLGQFLQELQLRSKEPTPRDNTVTLMTVHAAKGLGIDIVYLIGLAEDVMPSFQSRQKGDRSPEMEEERRNCFVAITRTKECLVLSYARRYRGYPKQPSRFLTEMGLSSSGY